MADTVQAVALEQAPDENIGVRVREIGVQNDSDTGASAFRGRGRGGEGGEQDSAAC